MEKDLFQSLREHLIAEIVAAAVLTASYTGKVVFGKAVLEVLARIPRHEFVPVELQPYAYLNRPLPIGFDKTVSQPFIVALMTDMLALRSDDIVLEIGAGAGYQAAVIAELAKRVYTVDIIDELVKT